jgi:surface protein
MEGAFESCINLEEIHLENINTEKLENLYGTFCACDNLKEIKGIENLNTKNVKNMKCFHGCKKLEKLNLKKWNT